MPEPRISTNNEIEATRAGRQAIPITQPTSVLPIGSPLSRADACSSTPCGLLRILLFFGLFLGLLYATDFIITTGLRKVKTSGFGVTNRIVNGQINADIVISGSSRAQTHYDPRIIEQATGLSTFNIGRNGSQTDLQLAVLKTYLHHNKKPKLVIHNLDSFSFVTSHEIYDPGQYIPYLTESPIYEAVKKVYPDAWKWKHFPVYAYVVSDLRFTWLTGIKSNFGLPPHEDHIMGFTPRRTPWTGDFEAFKRQNPDGIAFDIEPQGVRDLQELIDVCTSRDILLLLVYSPVYHEMQKMERNRSEIFASFHSVSAPTRTPILDFSDSVISANRGYFYNSQHLNEEGAAAFSRKLGTELSNYIRGL